MKGLLLSLVGNAAATEMVKSNDRQLETASIDLLEGSGDFDSTKIDENRDNGELYKGAIRDWTLIKPNNYQVTKASQQVLENQK